MVEFVKVAAVSEIPAGKMKGVVAKGKKILIANMGGKLYAVGDVCTHVGGPLHEGQLDGSTVTCPWHGSQFDVKTGKLVKGPAAKPEAMYEVKVEGNDVSVGI